MNEAVTYYDILDLPRNAPQEEISRAYRALAKKIHPDVSGSAHAMQLLNRAYKTLSNPRLRKEYDESLIQKNHKTFYQNHHFHEPNQHDLIAEERAAVKAVKNSAGKGMAKGVALIILGVIITAISYSAASSGGHYWFFWGLILWGGIAFLRSWYHFLNPYNSLHKVLDKPNNPHIFQLEPKGIHTKALSIILGCCAGAILLIILLSTNNHPSNTSQQTTNSTQINERQEKFAAYNTCKSEYDSLKGRLSTVNDTLNIYKNSDRIDEYNALIPNQNDLVRQTNDKAAECEKLRQNYNASL